MEIFIDRLNERDAEELFTFECNNRRFFEQTVPSRGDDYYTFETFKNRHRELLKEQEENILYFYLIINYKRNNKNSECIYKEPSV